MTGTETKVREIGTNRRVALDANFHFIVPLIERIKLYIAHTRPLGHRVRYMFYTPKTAHVLLLVEIKVFYAQSIGPSGGQNDSSSLKTNLTRFKLLIFFNRKKRKT